MFWLEAGALKSTTTNIVYLCRPMIKYVKIIAGGFLQVQYSIFNGAICRPNQAAREGVAEPHVHPPPGSPNIDARVADSGRGGCLGRRADILVQPPIHPHRGRRDIARERQCVQGDLGGASKGLCIIATNANESQDGDETVIYDSAQALLTLEKLYGLFPRIVGKGDSAAVHTYSLPSLFFIRL